MRQPAIAVITGVILAWLVTGMPTAALAFDEKFTLTVEDNYPPFVDLRDRTGGMALEILQTAADRAGLSFEIVQRPWARGLAEVREGRIFATGPYAYHDDKLRDFLLSAPLFMAEDLFFVSTDRPYRIESEADLSGLTICRPRGYSMFHREAMLLDGTLHRVTPADMASCFHLLLSGRVPVVWAERTEAIATMARFPQGTDRIRPEPLPALSVTMHLLISRADPRGQAVLSRLDPVIHAMERAGEIDAIMARHLERFELELIDRLRTGP